MSQYYPQNIQEYIGQKNILKQVAIDLQASKIRNVVYPHTLLYGNSGCGMFDDHGRLVGVADLLEQGVSRVIVVDENGVPHELGNVYSIYPKPGGFLAVSLQEIKKFIRE